MNSLGFVAFGEGATPDLPDYLNIGVEDARNLIPCYEGFCPLPALSPYSDALPATVRAGAAVVDSSDVRRVYTATATKLYTLSGLSWVDVSLGAGSYTSAPRWEFVIWDQTVQAWSYENDPQTINIGGAAFSNLTTAFQARTADVVFDRFVMAGNTNDATDGAQPNRLRWCAADDATNWTPSSVTLSDFQNLRSGGAIQRVMGGEYGIILCRNGIHRAHFVGAPVVFQIDEVEPDVGTESPDSAVRHGDVVYFLSEDGFRSTSGSGKSALIGAGRVDNTVLSEIDSTYLPNVKGVHYAREQSIVWAYPGPGNVSGQCNRLAMYNYPTGRWAFGDEVVDALMKAAVAFRSLDSLDSLFPNLDLMPGNLDGPEYSGGQVQIGAFGADNKLSFLSGADRTGTIETAEATVVPGRRAFISGLRVAVQGQATVRSRVGHRNAINKPVVWSPWTTENADGFCPHRVDNRFFRFQIELSGDYDHVFGMEVLGVPSGAR